jgi:hypothetical protein
VFDPFGEALEQRQPRSNTFAVSNELFEKKTKGEKGSVERRRRRRTEMT